MIVHENVDEGSDEPFAGSHHRRDHARTRQRHIIAAQQRTDCDQIALPAAERRPRPRPSNPDGTTGQTPDAASLDKSASLIAGTCLARCYRGAGLASPNELLWLAKPRRQGIIVLYALGGHHVAALLREAEYYADHVRQNLPIRRRSADRPCRPSRMSHSAGKQSANRTWSAHDLNETKGLSACCQHTS